MPARVAAVVCVLLTGLIPAGCATSGGQPADPRTVTRAGTATPNPPSPAVTDLTEPPHPAPTPSGPPVTGAAGISGTTVVDGCPVRRDPPCPDKPVAARLSISDPAGTVIATVQSGADGHFIVRVGPGSYVLRLQSIVGAPSRPTGPMTVTVQPNRFTTVTARFDTGMR